MADKKVTPKQPTAPKAKSEDKKPEPRATRKSLKKLSGGMR